MFRFTIRDVLWLTVVVGLSLALVSERRQRVTETVHLKQLADEDRKEAEKWHKLSDAQLKAFHIEQSNIQAARVHLYEAIQQKLQEMDSETRMKVIRESQMKVIEEARP